MASNQNKATYAFEGRNYPVCIDEDDNGCLTQVKGTILKCPVCPNVNNFKDLSHLVTHYGSRDHLKSANETKIRNDLGNAQSIRVWKLYKLWESNNQVWRLLLESHHRKQKKASRTQSESVLTEVASQPAEDETDVFNVNSKSESRASSEQAFVVPSMETNLTVPAKRGRGRPRKRLTNTSEGVIQDTKKAVLPVATDENTLHGSLNDYPVDPEAPKAKAIRNRRKREANNMDDDDVDVTGHAPVLKGKHYPGMDVFDFGHDFTLHEDLPSQLRQNDITGHNMQPLPAQYGGLNTSYMLQSGNTQGDLFEGMTPYYELHQLNGEQTLDQEFGISGRKIQVFKDTKKLKSDFKVEQDNNRIALQSHILMHSARDQSSPVTNFVMADEADKENVFLEESDARESTKHVLTNENQPLALILEGQGRGASFRGWQGPL